VAKAETNKLLNAESCEHHLLEPWRCNRHLVSTLITQWVIQVIIYFMLVFWFSWSAFPSIRWKPTD
jgi:hypothetical protein